METAAFSGERFRKAALILFGIACASCRTPKSDGPTLPPSPAEARYEVRTLALRPSLLESSGRLLYSAEARKLLVSDPKGHRILVVDPEREVIAPFAGDGREGDADGPPGGARFRAPAGMALAPSGWILVADAGGNCIRAILRDGSVDTFAGTGQAGYANGRELAAIFFEPSGVACEDDGSVVVADTGNGRLRLVDARGAVSTLAGSGRRDGAPAGAPIELRAPADVVSDGKGGAVVADSQRAALIRVSGDGAESLLAGGVPGGDRDGRGADARFLSPVALARVTGGFLVADQGNHTIRFVSEEGDVRTIAGTGEAGGVDGPAGRAQFASPAGIAAAPDGRIFVSEAAVPRLRVIVPVGGAR